MLNPWTSCTFSTQYVLFVFILTISTQENHQIEIHTVTAYCGHNTDPGFSVHLVRGSFCCNAPRLIFSHFLLMQQLHCKDVFLWLALSQPMCL